jgi:hypothetical protein
MSQMTTCREVPEKMEDRLIVALDVPSISEARVLIDKLEGVVSFFKVGLWLQFAAGFDGLLDYLLAKNNSCEAALTPAIGIFRPRGAYADLSRHFARRCGKQRWLAYWRGDYPQHHAQQGA